MVLAESLDEIIVLPGAAAITPSSDFRCLSYAWKLSPHSAEQRTERVALWNARQTRRFLAVPIGRAAAALPPRLSVPAAESVPHRCRHPVRVGRAFPVSWPPLRLGVPIRDLRQDHPRAERRETFRVAPPHAGHQRIRHCRIPVQPFPRHHRLTHHAPQTRVSDLRNPPASRVTFAQHVRSAPPRLVQHQPDGPGSAPGRLRIRGCDDRDWSPTR